MAFNAWIVKGESSPGHAQDAVVIVDADPFGDKVPEVYFKLYPAGRVCEATPLELSAAVACPAGSLVEVKCLANPMTADGGLEVLLVRHKQAFYAGHSAKKGTT